MRRITDTVIATLYYICAWVTGLVRPHRGAHALRGAPAFDRLTPGERAQVRARLRETGGSEQSHADVAAAVDAVRHG
jgi:hypothetical protein